MEGQYQNKIVALLQDIEEKKKILHIIFLGIGKCMEFLCPCIYIHMFIIDKNFCKNGDNSLVKSNLTQQNKLEDKKLKMIFD